MSDVTYADDVDSWRSKWTSGELEALNDPQRAISNLATEQLPKIRPTGERSVNLRILAAVASLSAASLAARAFGVVNQVVISDHFGAGVAMDAYFAALALPALLTNLMAIAMGGSVIPIYVRLMKAEQHQEASEVLSTLINVVTLFLIVILALMLFFPRLAITIFAPGVSPATIDIGVTLAPLLFPTLLLNIFVGFITSIFNATRRFAFPAFAAMLWPLGILICTIFLSAPFGISALGIGQLVGTSAQFLVMLVFTRKSPFRYRLVMRLRNPNARLALSQLWPAVFGAMIGQANGVIDQVVASTLGAGDISALNYAEKVISIPVTMIFVANAQAVLPYFSSQAAAKDYRSLKKTLNLFAWVVGIITLITTVGFIVFADLIVNLLFLHGAFTAESAQKTTATLIGFAVGLGPMAMCFMLPRVFNAMHQNHFLLRISLFTMVTNVALDIVLARYLGLAGIALGTSIDYALSMLLQITLLRSIIGPLGLLQFPPQLRQWLSPRYWSDKRRASQAENPRPAFPLWRTLRNSALVVAGFLVMTFVTMRDVAMGVRVSLSLALMVFFLRSPYLLLLAWAGVGAFYDAKAGGASIGWVIALASLPVFAEVFWRGWRSLARQTWAFWAYMLFLLWLPTSEKHSYVGLGKFALDEWGFINYLILMMLAIVVLTTPERLKQLLSVLLVVSSIVCVIGIVEYIFRFDGYQEPTVSWIYRVNGVFDWSNAFACYLNMAVAFCLYRLLTAARGQRRFWAGVLALHGLALGLTFSRTGIIAAILMILATTLLLNGKLRWWMLRGAAIGILLIVVLLLLPGLDLSHRLLGDNLLTLNARTSAWTFLLGQIDLGNLLGHGYGASSALLEKVQPGGVPQPHNFYLTILFDAGAPGLILLVASFVLLLWSAARKALRSHGEAGIAAAVSTGGMLSMVLFNLTSSYFSYHALGLHFWLLAALPYLPFFATATTRRKRKGAAPATTALETPEAESADSALPDEEALVNQTRKPSQPGRMRDTMPRKE